MNHNFYYSKKRRKNCFDHRQGLNKVLINGEWHEYTEMRDGDTDDGKSDCDDFELLGEAKCSAIQHSSGYRYKDCSRCKEKEKEK